MVGNNNNTKWETTKTGSQSCHGIWPVAIKDFKFFHACLQNKFEISTLKVLFFCSAFEDDLDSLNVVTTGRVVPFLHLLLRGTYHQPLMNKSDKTERRAEMPLLLLSSLSIFMHHMQARAVTRFWLKSIFPSFRATNFWKRKLGPLR